MVLRGRSILLYFGLILTPTLACAPVYFSMGALPIGGDTYYHIKYAESIITAGKVIAYNPYFPQDPLAYPLGSHILVANLSILSGIDVSPLVAVTPLLFGVMIVLVFYSFALRYLTKRFAFLATILFYGASVIPVSESAVNGARIANSIIFPYTSVLVGLYLFYCIFLMMTFKGTAPLADVLVGVLLGELVVTFHFLALGIFLVLVCYAVATHSRLSLRNIGITMLSAGVVSSFYWTHILASGVPTQTSAFGTYVQLSPAQYATTLGLSISALLVIGLGLLILKRRASLLKDLVAERYPLLFVFILVFLVSTQVWRLGLVLVNDLFLYFAIGPIAIISARVLAAIVGKLEFYNQKILGTVIVSMLVLTGPGLTYVSIGPTMTGPSQYLAYPFLGVTGWLNAHGSGRVFASELDSQYLIASEANVIPVAIPSVISDYYVSDLATRLNALQNILGYSIPLAVATSVEYNVTYIVSARPQPYYSITGSNYVTPLFPSQTCFHGSDASFDFDGDGVPEVFDQYLANNTNYYIIRNPTLQPSITMSYLFNPKTSGPVMVYVNNTLVQTLTGTIRGTWISDTIQLPKNLVGNIETVKVENRDLSNDWYLQTISILPTQFCPIPAPLFPRETVFLFSKTPFSASNYSQLAASTSAFLAPIMPRSSVKVIDSTNGGTAVHRAELTNLGISLGFGPIQATTDRRRQRKRRKQSPLVPTTFGVAAHNSN